jgi:hypothetical protein
MMSDDSRRWSTAVHECGHLVACEMLGGEIAGPVTIENRAFCFIDVELGVTKDDLVLVDPDLPLVLAPERVRRAIEARIIGHLAGPHAELLYGVEHFSGYVATSPDERRACDLSAALTARDREWLEWGNESPDARVGDDKARAWDEVGEFAGIRAARLFEFLQAETDALVRSEGFESRLAILVPALLEAGGTLGADQVRASLSTVDVPAEVAA